MNTRSVYILLLSLPLLVWSCTSGRTGKAADEQSVEEQPVPPLGFWPDSLQCVGGTVRSGDNFSALMQRLGLGADKTYALTQKCDTVFDVRRMRSGQAYEAYYEPARDTALEARGPLKYVVYNESRIRQVVFSCGDSLCVWRYDKPVEVSTLAADVTIHSSLWNDMTAAGASPQLIVDLADIYAWTVDFFGLQGGDRFRVLYDQVSCEGEVIGIRGISYAEFHRDTLCLKAIRFDQGDHGNLWWNEKGESLRKAFLKAPLQFTRISSGFSYARRHPVHGTVRPHTGVDYAAPKGTPVHSIGDGTVLSAGWGGGGGNTVKIRHNSVYTTAYLHLSRFAKGIKAGTRVRQGEVIGYVGATGTATGPHLDFRVWKNGSPINPLKLESPPSEPIRESNLPALDSVCTVFVTRLDSLLTNE